jgi:hypothetical protein
MLKEVAVAKFVLLPRDCPGGADNIASLNTGKFRMAVNSAGSLVLECCYVGADMTRTHDMDRSDLVDGAARMLL